jgi:hypothetical protein
MTISNATPIARDKSKGPSHHAEPGTDGWKTTDAPNEERYAPNSH